METVTHAKNMDIKCNGFTFISNFDSGNLARVEEVSKSRSSADSIDNEVDYEFNIWTFPDCAGTEFENGNRTWFYFGMKSEIPFALVKLNMVNLNRQMKIYSQGMAPVFRTLPGRSNWERIRDRPTFSSEDNVFTMSFKYRTLENLTATTYFAFTYPYSYSDLQINLNSIDSKLLHNGDPKPEDIYYHREAVCYSLEGRRVDLLTITSYHNITQVREARLTHLFPEEDRPRPFCFINKKVVFISARVHPGETPSSFVLNGVLSMLLDKDDPSAHALRRYYVFKLIPMLNPDGVARGHYRTDTRGVNLNRVYNDPSPVFHPSIYAARSLVCYYHFGVQVPVTEKINTSEGKMNLISDQVSDLTLDLSNNNTKTPEPIYSSKGILNSGLFLYIDLHGHASKKGIFMYGNHFPNITDNVECMLLPKLMSINSHHFHWGACNFSERNMYLRDRNGGLSKEGCGRVAVLKATGLVRSYTLECNYNTGQIVNKLPSTHSDRRSNTLLVPPKYSPHVFQEVGRGLCHSLLDLHGTNPNSRLTNSEFRNMCGLKEWLRRFISVTDSIAQSKPLRLGVKLSPLDKPVDNNRAKNSPLMLQVRTKCTAILALSGPSKQPQRRNKPDEIIGDKNKRIKVLNDEKPKWKLSRSEDMFIPRKVINTLEKKFAGNLNRRYSTYEHRKKPKSK